MMISCAAAPAAPEPAPTPPETVPAAATPAPEAPKLDVRDTPIPFDDDRKALTLAYLRAHVDPDAASIAIVPQVVVLHWTGGPTFQSAFATFSPSRLAGSRPELADAGALNVSAHFLVDRDGTIHRLMPETVAARHCIGLNHLSIGVENVGGGEEWPLTDAQVAANIALVRDLKSRFSIEVVIGHHEYRALEGTRFFQERDPTYRTGKVDPGDAFMARVRDGVADLGLAGATGAR